MKKSTLLWIGAGAVALYFLSKKQSAPKVAVAPPKPGTKGVGCCNGLGQVPYQAWSGEFQTQAPGNYYQAWGTQTEAGYNLPYGPGYPYQGQYQQVYTGAPTTACPYGTDQYGNCMAEPTTQSLAAACAAQGGSFNGTVCEITTPAPAPVTPVTPVTPATPATPSGTCPTGYRVVTMGGQSYCVKAPAATCDDGSTPNASTGLCADGTYPEMAGRGGGWQGGQQGGGGWQRGGGQQQMCQSTQYGNWFAGLCSQAGGTLTPAAAATSTTAAVCPSCTVGANVITSPRQLRSLVTPAAGTTAAATPAAATPAATCGAGLVLVTAASGQTYCLPTKQANRLSKQWKRYAAS
jgi:hypothetical protein